MFARDLPSLGEVGENGENNLKRSIDELIGKTTSSLVRWKGNKEQCRRSADHGEMRLLSRRFRDSMEDDFSTG